MFDAYALADQLQLELETLFSDEVIDPEEVRMLVFSVSSEGHELSISAREEWDEYFESGGSEGLAVVSLREWLDVVDAIEEEIPEEPVHDVSGLRVHAPLRRLDKPRWEARMEQERARLRGVVQAALRLIAVREPLVSLPGLVGLFELGLNPKSEEGAELVAFCHPHGAAPLWPVCDARPDCGSCYHWAALVPEGIVSFFPEGEPVEGDSDDEEDAPHATLFRFDDMVATQLLEDESYAIAFRMKGELEDRRYEHGHTLEDEGGAGPEEVDEALRAHLGSRPELLFDPLRFPPATDVEAVKRWLEVYRSTGQKTGPAVIDRLVDEQGLEAADIFLSGMAADDESRGATLARWAGQLVRHGRYETCLAVCEGLSGRPRGDAARDELAALMRLGRWEEVPARYERIVEEEPGGSGHLAPWKAVALVRLGRRDEAVALLEPLMTEGAHLRRNADCLYALALARYDDDRDEAVKLLRRAIAAGRPFLEVDFELHFEGKPEALSVLRDRRRWLEARQRLGDELKEKLVRTSVDALSFEGPGDPVHGAPVWSLQREVAIEDASHMKALVPLGEHVYVPDQANGLRVFRRDPSAGALAHMPVEEGVSYEALATDGRYLYAASYRTGLHVIDPSDPLAPRVIARSEPWTDETHVRIRVADGLAVVGDWRLEVFDVREPENPRRVTAIGAGDPAMDSSFYPDFEIVGPRLFLASNQYGLLVMDLSEPSAPRLESALAIDAEWRPEHLAVLGDLALLCGGHEHETWIVDVSNPAAPRSVGKLPIGWSARPVMQDDLVVIVDRRGRNWSLDLSEPSRPRVVAVHERLDAKGEDYGVREPTAALLEGDALTLLCGDKLQRLELGTDPRPGFEEQLTALEALHAPLVAWCEGRLEELARERPELRAGLVALEAWGDRLVLRLEGQSCLLGLKERLSDDEATTSFTVDATELYPAWPTGAGLYGERYERLYGRAEARVLRSVLEVLAGSEALRRVASGRTYLVLRNRAGTGVVKVLLNPERPWTSSRAVEPKAPPTVAELLGRWNGYQHVDALERRARADAEVFDEILQLAVEGNAYAQTIAARLREMHGERVREAFIEAAHGGNLKLEQLPVLLEYRDDPGVEAFIEQRYREGAPAARVAIAIALQRADSDEMVALARELLSKENDYMAADLAAKLLGAMEARLPDLREALLGWLERARENDNRVPSIAPHLFRAGHRELPAVVAAQAARDKHFEEMHDDGMFGDEEQDETCKAERLWTGWMLAERIRALREAGDTTSSIWPESLPLEPYRASWRYVLEAAKPHLPDAGDWDWLFERVVERVGPRALPEDRYAAERRLAELFFHDAFGEQRWRRALRVGEAITDAPEGTFEPRMVRRVQGKLFYVRLSVGWEHLKARKLEEARAIADALLAENPNDGQALFFDARLTWLEDSIDAAVAKVERYLGRIAMQDRAGRGRLCNLVGCALDEQKRYDEALPWFEKAAQAHPEDAAMYLANIAEIHEKRGDLAEAVRWAKAAREKGSTSELVARLLTAEA